MAKKDAEITGGARIDKPRLEKYMSEIRDIDKNNPNDVAKNIDKKNCFF